MPGRLRQLDVLLYPQLDSGWDNDRMRQQILAVADRHARVLDLGAGAGVVGQMRLTGHVGRVCGIDLDRAVAGNPHLDEAVVGRAESIPYPDDHFDLVVANNVFEHLESPERVVAEIARVLRPGGRCVAKTPNRWHYVPLIASCTPFWFHRWINARRGRRVEDTFPTYYRINTPAAIGRHAAAAGLAVERITLLEGRPEYLRMTAPTYLLGWLYERLVNRVAGLRRFRAVIIVVLRKLPCSGESGAPRSAAA